MLNPLPISCQVLFFLAPLQQEFIRSGLPALAVFLEIVIYLVRQADIDLPVRSVQHSRTRKSP